MSLARTLVRNVASHWVGYAIHVVVAFFLTPYIIHSLGETHYGIWTLVVGLTGYYGILDLGVGSGITQYLTRHLAANEIDKLNRSASTGFVALSGIGFLVFIGSLIIAFNAVSLLRIQAASSAEVTWVLAITGTSVAMQFAFFTYSAVFTAVQRFDLSNMIGISTRILSAAATIICLNSGYGLVGLSFVVAGTNVIDYLIRWRVAGRLLPAMRISPKLVNWESLREVVSFGIWNSVSAGSARLISYTDALVIAAFMPVAAVAPFAIAANLRSYFDEIFVRVGFVFFPAVTELDAKDDQAGLRQLYLVSSKFILLGSILLGSIAIFSARDFFRLWVGNSYAEPAAYPSIARLFYLLIVASMVAVAQRIGYQVLLGTRKVKLLALLFAAEGVSNLVVSLILVRPYGLIGVALGTLIPAILFQGLIQPAVVCQSLQISLRTYCTDVLLKPFVLLVTLAPLFLLASVVMPSGDWASLVFASGATFLLTIPFVVLIGLTKEERALLPIRRAAPAVKRLRSVDESRFTALQRCDQFVGRTTNWLYDHFRLVENYRLVVLADALENRVEFPLVEAFSVDRHDLAHRLWRRLNGGRPDPKMKRWLKELEPRILHSHFGYVAVNDFYLHEFLNVPWVVSFYGADVYQLGRQESWRKQYAVLFNQAAKILALGPAMAKSLEKLGCPENKIAIHPLGVDVSGIGHAARILRPGEPLKILFAGTFREKKGLQFAIESIKIARQEGLHLVLNIVGDEGGKPGDYEAKKTFLQLLRKYGLENHVNLHSFVPFQRLMELALSSHVFVAPSVTAADGDSEGTPFVLQQMMATGMPCIATRHSDIPFLFGDCQDMLVPERDAKAIVARFCRYVESPQKLIEDGCRLRRQVCSFFNVRNCTTRLGAVYDSLL